MIRSLMPILSPSLRMIVGIVFLGAAALKYSMITTTQHGPRGGIEAFAATISRGGVFPESIVQPIAYGIFGLELIVGIALLTHLAPKLWSGIAAFMLLAMTLYLVYLQARGKTPECGCLGQWDTSIPVSIIRNALLSLACLPSIFAKPIQTTAPRTASPPSIA